MVDRDVFEDLEDAVAELLQLYPHLADALDRDTAAVAATEHVSGGGAAGNLLPVNGDVLATISELHTDVWSTEHRARAHLGESTQKKPVPDSLKVMPSLYRRLDTAGRTREAARVAAKVTRWHRLVRTALGLNRPPRRLLRDGTDVHCPLHDQPLTALLQPGSEGEIHDEHAPERVTWRRIECVYCPHCHAYWSPMQYGLLGRLTREAERRRMTV